jgi:hypothetical protein
VLRSVRCVALATALVSAGCATTRGAAPIGKFKQSVDQSVAVIGAYYEELTAYERRGYLESAYLDPAQEILWTDAAGNPTPLAGRVFSAASIEARLDALRLVSVYARRLADLAGSEAPARFAGNADVLGAGLGNLTKTFEALSAKDVSARAYLAPVSSLIGAIGRVVLEQRRDAAIALAVRAGDQPVTDILNQFEADLALVVAPLRSTGEKQQLADLVNDYNTTRTSISAEARRRKGDRIQAAAESYFKAIAFNPGSVVAGLRAAHHALIKYATSPRRPADLAEFAAELEIFANRVDAAAAAVRGLRDVR